MQGQNGMEYQKSRTVNFNFGLAAKKTGPWTIPPVEVVVNGKSYKTKSLRIDVSPAGNAQRRKQGGNNNRNKGFPPGFNFPGAPNLRDLLDDEQDSLDQLYGQLLQRKPKDNPAFRSLPKNDKEAFFITLEMDKTSVYEGEQIFANWYIYTIGNVMQLERLKFPDLKGFWKEDIEAAPNILFQQEVVNGVPFKKALLASHAIFPIKAGEPVVDEYKVRAIVSLPSRGSFGFGFGQPYNYTRSSEKVKVTVKPLPTEGRPASFSGAVGKFDVHATVDGKNFVTGQPLTLKVRFEGEGNAKLIDLPAIEFPTSLERYDSQGEAKSEAKFFRSGQSYKEFSILLIPREAGDLTIPSIDFSYFDIESKKYIEKKTEPIVIKVEKGTETTGSNEKMKDPKVAKKSGPQLPDVIMTLENHKDFSFFEKPVFWISVYGIILLLLLGRGVYSFGLFRKEKDLSDLLHARIKKVKSEIKKSDLRTVGVESVNLVNVILGSLSDLGGSSLETVKLLDTLSPSIRREISSDLLKLLAEFQILGFAPESAWGELQDLAKVQTKVEELNKVLSRAIALAKER
jgi:hypothetical protein